MSNNGQEEIVKAQSVGTRDYHTCPDCQKVALRRRKANMRRNVIRRSTGNILDPWVCDDCGWTGDDGYAVAPKTKTENDYITPLEW